MAAQKFIASGKNTHKDIIGIPESITRAIFDW